MKPAEAVQAVRAAREYLMVGSRNGDRLLRLLDGLDAALPIVAELPYLLAFVEKVAASVYHEKRNDLLSQTMRLSVEAQALAARTALAAAQRRAFKMEVCMAVRKINGSYFILPDEQAPDRPVKVPFEHRAPITTPELLKLVADRDALLAALEHAVAWIDNTTKAADFCTMASDRQLLADLRSALAGAKGGGA